MLVFSYIMLPVLFSLGRFKFYSFGSFIALGTIAAGLFLYWAAKYRRLHTHHLFDTVLYTLVFALVGARLSYYFIYANQFTSLGQLFLFWQGGLVALGGIAAGFLAYVYFSQKEGDPIWQMLDIGALAMLVGWTIGKTGCFLSTCSIGSPTAGMFGINGSFPVDLFSASWAVILFAIMLQFWLRNRLSDGVIFFLSLEGLFLGELLINTLKLDFATGLARIQAIILLGLIVAIYLIFWRLHGPKFQKNRFGIAVRNFVFRHWPHRQ